MKKYFQNLTNLLQKFGYKKLFLIALVIRLILVFPFSSGDVDNHAIWGMYAAKFGFSGYYDYLSFGNYARPNYPPLAILIFWLIRVIWEMLLAFFLKLNTSIFPILPSEFLIWFDHKGYFFLLKLPGLAADFFIGSLLFKYIKEKYNEQKALLAASLYWFNPATIYVSSMWGQIDSVVIFFALLSVILLEKKKIYWGFLTFTCSILIKPIMLMIAPVILYIIWKQKLQSLAIFKSVSASLIVSSLVGSLFAPGGIISTPSWLFKNYLSIFIPGGTLVLPYIQVRAFNFWTLLTGSNFVSDTIIFLGVPLFEWAIALAALAILVIIFQLIKRGNYWLAAALLVFATFLFSPRIHERYLQPIVAFLIPVVIKYPKFLFAFIAVDIFHFLNLFAAWEVPYPIIAQAIYSDYSARLLSLGLVMTFLYLLKNYPKDIQRK